MFCSQTKKRVPEEGKNTLRLSAAIAKTLAIAVVVCNGILGNRSFCDETLRGRICDQNSLGAVSVSNRVELDKSGSEKRGHVEKGGALHLQLELSCLQLSFCSSAKVLLRCTFSL